MAEHPVFTPPELVREWQIKIEYCSKRADREAVVAKIFQLGADQELEACLDEIYKGVGLRLIPYGSHRELLCSDLRAARRPKPPALKEQALKALEDDPKEGAMIMIDMDQFNTIRRALESLPE